MSRLNELKFRKSLAEYIIEVLKTHASDDPRQADALAYYRDQLVAIETSIANYSESPDETPDDHPDSTQDGKPAPIVIGLKTAELFARPGKVG